MKKLTEKQVAMLGMITEGYLNGKTPTVYEIADHFKIKTSTVFTHIRALGRKGQLTRTSEARSIKPADAVRLIASGRPGAKPVAVIVLDEGVDQEMIGDLWARGYTRVVARHHGGEVIWNKPSPKPGNVDRDDLILADACGLKYCQKCGGAYCSEETECPDCGCKDILTINPPYNQAELERIVNERTGKRP